MNLPFIDLKSQYENHKLEINEAILKVLESTQFIMGEELKILEKNLADYVGTTHAIGCANGTDALQLALMALELEEGDEVITSPFTFIATAEVMALLKIKPVFVDIDEATYSIDPALIEKKITPKTKAIIPVSLYGQCADMNAINEIAKQHNLAVIEDGAQSFGAEYDGKKSCALSTIGCTSFFPSKPLGCYGDGGALFTNDEKIAKRLRILLNHGQEKRYVHDFIGLNSRLDTVQAVVLNVKLKYFEDEVKKRIELGARYNELLEGIVTTQKALPNTTNVYAQYSIRVKNRDEFAAKLSKLGVPTAVHYPIPLHLQPAFSFLKHKVGDFPISEKVSNEIISLPMSPYLTHEQQDFVVKCVKESLQC